MPDWHKSILSHPACQALSLLSVSYHFNKIRWVYYRFVKLHYSTLQYINWLDLQFFSLPYISILFLFLHTMIPCYSTESLLYLLAVIERKILNIVLARTNRLSEMATMHLKKKVSNINFCKKCAQMFWMNRWGPVKKARNTLTKRICAASAQKDNLYPNIKIKKRV